MEYMTSQVFGCTSNPPKNSVPLPEPSPEGQYLVASENQGLPHHVQESGLPIVRGTEPRFVFGTGVLHPPRSEKSDTVAGETVLIESESDFDEQEFVVAPEFEPDFKGKADDQNAEGFGLERSQNLRPSAMGLTALLDFETDGKLHFTIQATTYGAISVQVESQKNPQQWWVPNRHRVEIAIPWTQIIEEPGKVQHHSIEGEIGKFASLQTRIARQSEQTAGKGRTLTAVVKHDGDHSDSLFQFEMSVELEGGSFLPGGSIENWDDKTEEQQEVEFLYRHVGSFAIGHGVSANWEQSDEGIVRRIYSESIPVFYAEVLNTTVEGMNFGMQTLANATKPQLNDSLGQLISEYSEWISRELKRAKAEGLREGKTAERLAEKARHVENRMRRGLELLVSEEHPLVHRAFSLANQAMFLQQQRSRIRARSAQESNSAQLTYETLELPQPANGDFGSWRPFQIGFLLMVLSGLVDESDPARDEVDLLFFPTGGGKTEAYLGASALTMFYRRLENPGHSGVDVIMRYTLRLLTIQQFERSAGLIVAMETIRRENSEELGTAPFSIGVWLGSETTPNNRQDALSHLKKKGPPENGANPFILNKCPWCGAQFGFRKTTETWLGYQPSESKPKTLRFQCPDRANCAFSTPSQALPIWITDDDVYDEKPSFILGTVDKFARLAWEPRARAIFNLGSDGNRIGLPPGLIIQDELHLISGPLGSMVGLYEAVIEDLCTRESQGKRIRPKIIASTATTRRYQEHVHSLFGREDTVLFPQAINRANETFFSSVARKNGSPVRGTAFVGVNPATYSTGQVSAAQLSAVLSQAPAYWDGPAEQMDFYSTAVWFFSSLKELGQTLTLMQSTVISLIQAMWRDARLPVEKSRSLEPMMELTGRISAGEVARSLERLGVQNSEKGSVSTCLASSIMEVGVDVPRLGLLTIMGQPKMTSQYIQVAGRVGRAREKGPGLVVMLYNPSRPRDRSIYEQFRSFHERLYSRVEPLSVTPFALQTLEKGLLGAILAHYRMTTPMDIQPTQPDHNAFLKSVSVLRKRGELVQAIGGDLTDFEKSVESLEAEWVSYKPAKWSYTRSQESPETDDYETALLRATTKEMTHIPGDKSVLIPVSMRSVDNQSYLLPLSNVYSSDDKDDE